MRDTGRSPTAAGSVLLAVFLALQTSAVNAADCGALLKQHLQTDLALTYATFDQTEGRGFRVLNDAGCNREAAQLIDSYRQQNHAPQSSLIWHAAQMYAMAGDYPTAIEDAKAVLQEKEDFGKDPLRWNDYVLATIAFLQHDRASLLKHRDSVANGAAVFWGNKNNLDHLNGLVANFDKSYLYAYNHPQ